MSGHDSKCFSTTNKGEIPELNSQYKDKRQDAVKKDNDPYVRKTTAVCVAKLYDINAELVEDALKDLISDNNPMVVVNAVASLAEIQENSSKTIFEITSHTLSKLLTALNECT